VFVKALTAGLQLKQEFPNSNVKLRNSYEKAPLRDSLSDDGFSSLHVVSTLKLQ
jgi:hypothetical protein